MQREEMLWTSAGRYGKGDARGEFINITDLHYAVSGTINHSRPHPAPSAFGHNEHTVHEFIFDSHGHNIATQLRKDNNGLRIT